MSRWRNHLALLLLALWLPATLHCGFEAAGIGGLFGCAIDHHAPDTGGTPTDPARDACDVVESGWFKLADHPPATATPALHICLLSLLTPPPALPLQPPAGRLAAHLAAPREIARTWHFVARAAPAPRAPSLAS